MKRPPDEVLPVDGFLIKLWHTPGEQKYGPTHPLYDRNTRGIHPVIFHTGTAAGRTIGPHASCAVVIEQARIAICQAQSIYPKKARLKPQ
jgi:hypothetical protein